MDKMCSGKADSNIPKVKELAQKFMEFETEIANWTSTYMCSRLCPCYTTTQPTLWDETRLKKYYRTATVINMNYTDPKTRQTYAGFEIRDTNYQTTFYNCFKNKIQPLDPKTFTYDEAVIGILQNIENTFKCNGICDYGNFYFF